MLNINNFEIKFHISHSYFLSLKTENKIKKNFFCSPLLHKHKLKKKTIDLRRIIVCFRLYELTLTSMVCEH